MRRREPLLRVTGEYIRRYPVFVAEVNDIVLGFYSLNGDRYEIELDLLFVEPDAIGQGTGRALLAHACATALEQGFASMYVESDPGAESFYSRFGGVRVATVASTVVTDRELPVLRFQLPCTGRRHAD